MTPMPFPRTLIETLAHTAAFVDQAGYLAKYAEEVSKLQHASNEWLLTESSDTMPSMLTSISVVTSLMLPKLRTASLRTTLRP